MDSIRHWFQRLFSNPQLVGLTLFLIAGFAFVLLTGEFLAPFFASVIMAYLLESIVSRLERIHVPRLAGAVIVVGFLGVALLLFVFLVVPSLSRQVTQIVVEIPKMIAVVQEYLLGLPERYPNIFTDEQVAGAIGSFGEKVSLDSQQFLSQSIKFGVGATYVMLYLVLVPFMVFFMLKDKHSILAWFRQLMPRDNQLTTSVLTEMDAQIGNYVRGKAIEILVIGTASYIAFFFLDLNYALLLGVLVGLSVLVPYVGATVVTIPVLAVAYFDPDASFGTVFIVYGIIQFLDGNLLVPLLFSEAVDLHPIAIIVAILFFGGIWGFWGVFFAIPLATLVKAVMHVWPRQQGLAAAP